MKPFSFIIPSRNNLTYLKMCYDSIRKNAGYTHEICFADDFSEDGTLEWILVQMKRDQKDVLMPYDVLFMWFLHLHIPRVGGCSTL